MSGAKCENVKSFHIVAPTRGDGAAVWRLFRDCRGLDLNSSYAYVLLCDHFRATSAVARATASQRGSGPLAGAALGFRPPHQQDTLFIWQIGVHPDARGAGLGSALLAQVVDGVASSGVQFLEAHVAPGNRASEALFLGFAAALDAPAVFQDGYSRDDFPDAHAPERLLRIGPFVWRPAGPAEME